MLRPPSACPTLDVICPECGVRWSRPLSQDLRFDLLTALCTPCLAALALDTGLLQAIDGGACL